MSHFGLEFLIMGHVDVPVSYTSSHATTWII